MALAGAPRPRGAADLRLRCPRFHERYIGLLYFATANFLPQSVSLWMEENWYTFVDQSPDSEDPFKELWRLNRKGELVVVPEGHPTDHHSVCLK